MNIPNSISLFRTIILTPLTAYFFLIGDNYLGLAAAVSVAILDMLDGFLARRLKQVTKLGRTLDSTGDSIFILIIGLTFLYLNYVTIPIVALFFAHRFTRLLSILYFKFEGKGFYSPFHMKITGFIVLLYLIAIPFLVQYLGRQTSCLITIFLLLTTHLILATSLLIAVNKFRKGKLKLSH